MALFGGWSWVGAQRAGWDGFKLRAGRPAGPWQTAVWMTGGLLCGRLALAP